MYLNDTKKEIRTAINSKGVPVPIDLSFREYVEKIQEISDAEEPNFIEDNFYANAISVLVDAINIKDKNIKIDTGAGVKNIFIQRKNVVVKEVIESD